MSGIRGMLTRRFYAFLFAFVFLAALIVVGLMFLGGKDSEKSKTSSGGGVVCGQDIIQRTNGIVNWSDYDKVSGDIDKIIADIKSRDGYGKDANCINALFVVAITDYGRIPIEEQKSLLNNYKGNESKVDKNFAEIYTHDQANSYINREL